MRVEAIVLDFDGVVLESVEIKTAAFRALFAGFPRLVDDIVAYHRSHPGVSRYRKFEHIYRGMLRLPLSDAEMERLDRRFSRLVRDGMLTCRPVPGAVPFLKYASRRAPVYLASATPERELKTIVRLRGLAEYFTGVSGAPRQKDAAIERAIQEGGFNRRAVVFVGDAQSDLEAARACRVRFVRRRAPDSPAFRWRPSVATLAELQSLLKSGECGLRL